MPSVSFTQNLKRFFPGLTTGNFKSSSVNELLIELDQSYPGIKDYIINEDGSLRKHVNIFIGNELIHDRTSLSDQLTEKDQVYIMQALSGG